MCIIPTYYVHNMEVPCINWDLASKFALSTTKVPLHARLPLRACQCARVSLCVRACGPRILRTVSGRVATSCD